MPADLVGIGDLDRGFRRHGRNALILKIAAEAVRQIALVGADRELAVGTRIPDMADEEPGLPAAAERRRLAVGDAAANESGDRARLVRVGERAVGEEVDTMGCALKRLAGGVEGPDIVLALAVAPQAERELALVALDAGLADQQCAVAEAGV